MLAQTVFFFACTIMATIAFASSMPHTAKNPQTCVALKQAPSPHCGRVPTPAVDGQGNLWVVFEDAGMIYLTQAQKNGDFTLAIAVTPKPEAIYNDGENRPKLAFGSQGEIYISWVHKTPQRYTGDVRFSRSVDGGRSFSNPITVNDDGLVTSHRFDSLIVADDDSVHLVWIDKRDKVASKKIGKSYTGAALYHSVSHDKGQSFAPNQKLVDHACECCRIAMDLDQQGRPLIFWRHIFENGFRDHAVQSLSTVNKRSATNVSHDGWKINACPHHGPDISVDDRGSVHAFWFTGAPGRGGLYYGRLNNSWETVENVVHISNLSSASRPQISALGHQLFLVWKELEGDKTHLRMRVSQNYGVSWSDPTTVFSVSGKTDHPQMVLSGNKIIVTWWTAKQGLQLIDPHSNLSLVRLSDSMLKMSISKQDAMNLQSFDLQALNRIERIYSGKPFVLSLWSLDCPPCYEELNKFSQWLNEGRLRNLVLINTDDVSRQTEVVEVLQKNNLRTVDNWMFANIAPEQLRTSIDSSWFGELPRSYRYDPEGQREGRSGVFGVEWIEPLKTEQ